MFINAGQLSILDGSGIFGGRTVRTFTDATDAEDPGFPFITTSTTNRLGVITATGDPLFAEFASQNSGVFFRAAYMIRNVGTVFDVDTIIDLLNMPVNP